MSARRIFVKVSPFGEITVEAEGFQGKGCEAAALLEDIGGRAKLREWLTRRAGAFSESAKTCGLPAPKGLLIAGIPCTGKSLTAKATAGAARSFRHSTAAKDLISFPGAHSSPKG